jgi:hypothetical protein
VRLTATANQNVDSTSYHLSIFGGIGLEALLTRFWKRLLV